MPRDRLQQFRQEILHSNVQQSRQSLKKLWTDDPNPRALLDAVNPLPLFTFSHRYSTIHVPKEQEYLYRLLPLIPLVDQLDFLDRFVEYLAWSPKYIINPMDAVTSGHQSITGFRERYLSAMEARKGLASQFYATEFAQHDGLDNVLPTILKIGCHDISQAIGHYFSCTESVVQLAFQAQWPHAKPHLYVLTSYLMQSSPILLKSYQRPTMPLDKILHHLVKKGGFVGYHYMIVANGLVKNKEQLGDEAYLHALHGLELMLSQLPDTITPTILDDLTKQRRTTQRFPDNLKKFIWEGRKPEAFSVLRAWLRDEGVTTELMADIAHSFTQINQHPHDPHYVTVPTAVYELIPHLDEGDCEIILAQVVDFAINRINQYGLTT